MVAIAPPQNSTVSLIYKQYEMKRDGHRPHLGASLIGNECERSLWYTFRWCTDNKFDGRMLRLFERGHRTEFVFEAELKSIGVKLHTHDNNGNQFRIDDFNGHFSGSLDGAGIGFPEAPKTWHVTEFKTHNDKSFKELEAKGVEESKPLHYAQMQTYMGYTEMTRSFYLAENKNDDSLYQERVKADPEVFARMKMKAERVIRAKEPLEKMSYDVNHFKCKGYKDPDKAMCDHYFLCHQSDAPEVNCRTCVHSTPELDGGYQRWSCALYKMDLPFNVQKAACRYHLFIPALLVNWADMIDAKFAHGDYYIEYRNRTGEKNVFRNGPEYYTSFELYDGDAPIIGDSFADQIRDTFGAKIGP